VAVSSFFVNLIFFGGSNRLFWISTSVMSECVALLERRGATRLLDILTLSPHNIPCAVWRFDFVVEDWCGSSTC
jgi:hypothetical protein